MIPLWIRPVPGLADTDTPGGADTDGPAALPALDLDASPEQWLSTAAGYVTPLVDWLLPALLILVVLVVVAAILARILGRTTERVTRRLGPGRATLLRRAVVYGIWVSAAIIFLNAVGADAVFTWVAGAAGILGVALGFASQTSAANVISGLFLLGERPFEKGDVIAVAGVEGEVLSIDLLSLKLRTFQNTFVRVPNETVMKTEIINYTRFPVRRSDLVVRVRPGTDLDRVKAIATEVAREIPIILNDPPANVLFMGIVEGGIELKIVAWAVQATFFDARARFSTRVVAALEEQGVGLVGSRREVSVTRLREGAAEDAGGDVSAAATDHDADIGAAGA